MQVLKLLLLTCAVSLVAKEPLYLGLTYDFAELDIIDAIQSHIKNNSDKIEQKYNEMRQQSMDKIENMEPKLKTQLRFATQDIEFYANTRYTNPEDIKDAQGKILYRAGFTYDPMDYISLPYSIVFINAERESEVTWLKNSNMLNSAKFRILITGGKYSEVTAKLGEHVFFANDKIITRLNIKATPSIASQEGKRLKIREVCIDCNQTK